MSLATVSTLPTAPAAPAPALRLVPDGSEVRGFALYVGIDEAKARAAGVDLPALVDALRALTAELVPSAETYAAVALAPAGLGGRDVDIVRRALADRTPAGTPKPETKPRRTGLTLDLGRKKLRIDGETAPLTYREFELLQFLVLREGRTVTRTEIIGALWSDAEQDVPNERTIDVHVRRLRAKLGDYGDVVRTVRGGGYRFDRHADVVIRYGEGPSPDRF
ncbi:winged helix-turn-helix domain-containing protein [Amnibacterium kyonggiense]|uniref:Transcriptional regulator n=1 Tax=Amnibacterium kyonggiense TaxID=595671 RepID=A0A4V3EAY7_9MICO|nr:winged helix-turn-helix domain-containing protein [Amnibacterium kyonggiense]TDS79664.1 transcriptional regulator [Amnibacterium kyonggiense]